MKRSLPFVSAGRFGGAGRFGRAGQVGNAGQVGSLSRFGNASQFMGVLGCWFAFSVLLLFTGSCSQRISAEATMLPPIIETDSASQKYNMQLDFMKHHFSGMLIVRRMPNEEIRILATTYFGLSLFDFALRGETFEVKSCIEPMKKEKILKLLEADFRQLFLPNQAARMTEKSKTFEKRISGRGFGKSIFSLSEYVDGKPKRVQIRHPWIRLTIQLDPLSDIQTSV